MARWENWSGSVACNPRAIHKPSTFDEIVSLVRRCRDSGRRLRVVGAGHSFMPLVATDDVLLSLENFQGIDHVDTATNQVTVRAGTTINALGEGLFKVGLAQQNLGDIDVQSIAGAISTGTHGSGADLGSLSTQVVGLRLVTGAGDVIDCSETENREVFKAAQVSLGALGVITHVTLQCVPAYKLHYEWKKMRLDDVLANLEALKAANRNFEFFWIPFTNVTLVKTMNVTEEPARERNRLRRFNETVIENGVLWLLSAIARTIPAASRRIASLMGMLVSNGDDVQYSHRIYATVRAVKFQEMEYSIPAEHFVACLREIDACLHRYRFNVHFPVECRFVRADDIDLSPANGRDSAYIAVHMFKGMPHEAYFEAVEQIFKRYEGRPHWGKLNTRTGAEFRKLYARWDDFQALRARLDPDGLLVNPYFERVMGQPQPTTS
jgi:FAD-linked oxidoreductase